MGVNEKLEKAHSVFVDSSVPIYYFENHKDFGPRLRGLFQAFDAGQKSCVTSTVRRLEVLTKPIADKNNDLVSKLKEGFFDNPKTVRVRVVDDKVAERAAEIRAASNFKVKAPDAIQLAAAELEHVDVFLTNDSDLAQFSEVEVVTVAEMTE